LQLAAMLFLVSAFLAGVFLVELILVCLVPTPIAGDRLVVLFIHR
jgi:hypothetical protein